MLNIKKDQMATMSPLGVGIAGWDGEVRIDTKVIECYRDAQW